MTTFSFDSLTTLLISVLCLLAGVYLKNRSRLLQKFCIPSPVIGGFLVSLSVWLLLSFNLAEIRFDTSLQNPLMVAFFTTVGLEGSLKVLRSGDKTLLMYLGICWVLALFQNTFGAALAAALGEHPVIGVMAGAVSLTGGHGGAATFGAMAEALGVPSASVAAVSSATFGLIAGSLLGGPAAHYLIRRHRIAPPSRPDTGIQDTLQRPSENAARCTPQHFLSMLALILGIMTAGRFLSEWFTGLTGFVLPAYVGAMLVAVLVRNLHDCTGLLPLHPPAVHLISETSLGLFLGMAMISLKIWQLQSIAAPLLLILFLQTAVLSALAIFIVFRLLGRDYDAAVMCAGLMGHGLGATPNGMANMSAVCERYRAHSAKAFMIVPLSGAVLIDIVAIPYHTYLINLFT
ncbi:sodium/glutamate symporter [Neisseria leonii]|uniref:Sodium/glutamate symporter n=1 Tax=Neisseria leonii TaxID=2995413 RepID=A0A9X4E3R0_9NEIS|nr:sodium/glutamate symporter [Neisseria sp. 51.81]MDD9327421.1 sodium/glutamate symporter [Neisseria sp. 51.81]